MPAKEHNAKILGSTQVTPGNTQVQTQTTRNLLEKDFLDFEGTRFSNKLKNEREQLRRQITNAWDKYITQLEIWSKAPAFHFKSFIQIYLSWRKTLAANGRTPEGSLASTPAEIESLRIDLDEPKADWVLRKLLMFCPKSWGVKRPPQGFSPLRKLTDGFKSRTAQDASQNLRKLRNEAQKPLASFKQSIKQLAIIKKVLEEAKQSGLFEPSVFEDFEQRVNNNLLYQTHMKNVLETLDKPDLLKRYNQAAQEVQAIASQFYGLDELLESLSESMLRDLPASEDQIRKIRDNAENWMKKLFEKGQEYLYELNVSTSVLVVRFVRIDKVLEELANLDSDESLIEKIQEAKDAYLDDLLKQAPGEIEAAVLKTGTVLSRLGHKVRDAVEEIKLEREARKQERFETAVLSKPDAPECQEEDRIDIVLVSYLVRNYQLSQDQAQTIASKLNLGRFKEVENALEDRFGKTLKVLIRKEPKFILLDEKDFDRRLDAIDYLLSKRGSLDPTGYIERLDPQRTIEAYLPRNLTATKRQLEDLKKAIVLIANQYAPGKQASATELWQEFMAGINQIWTSDQDNLITAELVAMKILEVNFPNDFIPELAKVTTRKLAIVCGANTLDQIRRLPGNNLERIHNLSVNSEISYAIRINDLWRVIFSFSGGKAQNVCLSNYH
ncbi:MAG: type II toxin-antitoxin system RelE/ParE family toxin [Bdellovibrionota bacterium]